MKKMKDINVIKKLLLIIIIVLIVSKGIYADEYEKKIFKIKFKEIEEIALLIKPMISEQGTITIQPRGKTITVYDLKENISRIEKAIIEYDIPSPSIKIILKLIEAEEKKQEELQSKMPDFILKMKNLFKYTAYNVKGEFLLETSEGSISSFSIAEDYRISFRTSSVNAEKGIIQLRNFTIEKKDKKKEGFIYKNLLTTSMNLKDREMVIIGATQWETSPKAIFIALIGEIKK